MLHAVKIVFLLDCTIILQLLWPLFNFYQASLYLTIETISNSHLDHYGDHLKMYFFCHIISNLLIRIYWVVNCCIIADADWRKTACVACSLALWVDKASCKVLLGTLLNMHLRRQNSDWHVKLQQTANGKTNKHVSCDQPAILRHSHCKYRHFYLPYITFPAFTITNKPIGHSGFLDFLVISFTKIYVLFFFTRYFLGTFVRIVLQSGIIFINIYAVFPSSITPTCVVTPYSRVYEAKVTLLMW